MKGKLCGLRQQSEKEVEEPFLCISDFVAPKETKLKDYVGMFAVAVFGANKLVQKFQQEDDDFHAIMTKAIADRLVKKLFIKH